MVRALRPGEDREASNLIIVENWIQELKARVGN